MDITTRNLFRLLRAGAFGQQDRIEPMSVWKWKKTHLLAVAHGVEAEAFEGLEVVGDQFFAQLVPPALHDEWGESAVAARRRQEEEASVPLPEKLTARLEDIAETFGDDSADYEVLSEVARLAYALLTDDYWVRRLLLLGETVRERGHQVDRSRLQKWIRQTNLTRMAQLEGVMLVVLMGVQSQEVPVPMPKTTASFERQVDAIASAIPHGREQWQFQQGKHIFIHTDNASAMVWNARRSARFFRYSPLHSLTNLFTSFARSLTNIEE